MSEEQRNLLARVAAGELSPEEALALLEHVGSPTPSKPTASARRVVVEADLGAVSVTADRDVRDAVAVGGHTMRRDAGVVRIEGAHGRSVVGDGRLLPRLGRKHALRIRVNPDAELEVKLGAGSVHVEGLRRKVVVAVDLGTATLEGITGPFDIRVASGTVSAAATMTEGASRISCDLGSVNVRLDRSSNVTITASTDAGRITLPGQRGRPAMVFGTNAETVVGSGGASLEVRAAAGSIAVAVEKK